MPIIPTVGRRAPRIRLLIAAMYGILSVGAVAMVYPFLLMISTSITSSTDTNEFRVVPRYLYEIQPLYAKYVDDKYAGDLDTINALYHTSFKKTDHLAPSPDSLSNRRFVGDWREFVRTLPLDWKYAAFRGYGLHPIQVDIRYRAHAQEAFHGDIGTLNRTFTEENESFRTVKAPLERLNKRGWAPDDSPKMRDFERWKASIPEEQRPAFSVEAMFAKYLKEDAPAYHGDAAMVAAVWGGRGFDNVWLAPEPPPDPRQRRDWEEFVRKKVPLRYVAPLGENDYARIIYRAFLRRKYRTVSALNSTYGSAYGSFDAIPRPEQPQPTGVRMTDWGEFIEKAIPLALLRVDTPENRFRSFEMDRMARRGVAAPTSFAALSALRPPYYEADSAYVRENAAALREDFMARNYRFVLDYILLHGRGLLVTAIFCIAAIATTLIVNPLCAYALSRFSLPYTYKVLLFLLATMAFPAEVAMIPNFLLLKQLGLLNTYWALILPGAASGFSIFLLKGFFDSLPKEFYEAGMIDGAGEARMFFTVTIPLSKPIFAVIALQAFTAAYGAFMFALLVCQNPRMWTLMVWLYELQITNPQYIIFAGLILAALPTLLVFLFAQNVIMRGIILPSEK